MEIGYSYHIEGEYVKVDMESLKAERTPFNLRDLGYEGDCVLVTTDSASPAAREACDAEAVDFIEQLLAQQAFEGSAVCVKVYRRRYPFDEEVGAVGENTDRSDERIRRE